MYSVIQLGDVFAIRMPDGSLMQYLFSDGFVAAHKFCEVDAVYLCERLNADPGEE